MSYALGFLYAAAFYIALPALIIVGSVRWSRRSKPRSLFSNLALIGFALSTLSGLLAAGFTLYAHAVGIPCYDPRLLTIYLWGIRISQGALVFAVIGLWPQSALQWYAPACAIGVFLFWFLSGSGEAFARTGC